MKIVVFGANGQMGQCFQYLQRSKIDRDYQFFEKSNFDISDPDAYSTLDGVGIDVILNCTAYTKVDQAESEREIAYKVNVSGPKLLAEYGEKHHIPLIHFSTDYVYGPATKPIRESHDIAPVNYYGQSKWEGEEVIRQGTKRHLILRTSWLYSEYGHNFVKTMMRLAENRNEINVVDDQTGSPTYGGELALAIDHILHTTSDLDILSWGTYNFAQKGAVTWYEFARNILAEKSVAVHPITTDKYPTPAKRPNYSVLDSSLFEKAFHWDLPDWKVGLGQCLRRLNSL